MAEINIQTADRLIEKIFFQIRTERDRGAALRRLFLSLAAGSLFTLLLIPVWHAFSSEFIASGFGQYFSLFFSDLRSVTADWQDFSLSLLESFPVLNAILLLSAVFTVLLSVKYILKYGYETLALRRLKYAK